MLAIAVWHQQQDVWDPVLHTHNQECRHGSALEGVASEWLLEVSESKQARIKTFASGVSPVMIIIDWPPSQKAYMGMKHHQENWQEIPEETVWEQRMSWTKKQMHNLFHWCFMTIISSIPTSLWCNPLWHLHQKHCNGFSTAGGLTHYARTVYHYSRRILIYLNNNPLDIVNYRKHF